MQRRSVHRAGLRRTCPRLLARGGPLNFRRLLLEIPDPLLDVLQLVGFPINPTSVSIAFSLLPPCQSSMTARIFFASADMISCRGMARRQARRNRKVTGLFEKNHRRPSLTYPAPGQNVGTFRPSTFVHLRRKPIRRRNSGGRRNSHARSRHPRYLQLGRICRAVACEQRECESDTECSKEPQALSLSKGAGNVIARLNARS